MANYIYYTTCNGKLSSRSSYGFKSKDNAQSKCVDQNERAEKMGLDARYCIGKCANNGRNIPSEQIRD